MASRYGALSGSSYLNQDYESPEKPSAGAGWGGILASGLTTAIGVAADSPYLVGAGGAAAESYRQNYSNFNKSLMEERRANRLADAAMAREMHLREFERGLTAEDREFERQRQLEADRREDELHASRMKESQIDIAEKERLQDPEYRAELAKEKAGYEVMLDNMKAEAAAARNDKERRAKIQAIEQREGIPEHMKQNAIIELETGIKLKTPEPKYMSDEEFGKSFRSFFETAIDAGQERDVAYQNAIKETVALDQTFSAQRPGGRQTALQGAGAGAEARQTAITNAAAQIEAGNITEQEVLDSAETPEEREDAIEAIQLAREKRPSGFEQAAEEMTMGERIPQTPQSAGEAFSALNRGKLGRFGRWLWGPSPEERAENQRR